MSTIKDVAKRAKVSISTASYAINNQPNVHPDTRKRVLEAARELNYTPHFSARNLKTKKTGNIGVFIYGFSGPIFSDVLEGIRQKLQEYGYNIIVSSGLSSTTLLLERQVDGAIIFDSNISDEVLRTYAANGSPIIVLDRFLTEKNIYSSVIDNEGLVERFMTDILAKGYARCAYLSGPEDSFNNNHRYIGFKRALEKAGRPDHLYYHGDFTVQSGYAVGKTVAQTTNRPDFVYCANDESAIGFARALKEEGLRIPEDIAIAGFDNIQMGDFIHPKLTTIGIDHILWGKHVADVIVTIIDQGTSETVNPPEGRVYWRESC
jgi:LacI family transcriptional regulator